jgi:serine/threonine-protein kinase RIO1
MEQCFRNQSDADNILGRTLRDVLAKMQRRPELTGFEGIRSTGKQPKVILGPEGVDAAFIWDHYAVKEINTDREAPGQDAAVLSFVYHPDGDKCMVVWFKAGDEFFVEKGVSDEKPHSNLVYSTKM